MRQQILVDMDGVLADVYAQLIIFEYRDSGIKLNIENMYGKTELEAFPSFEKHVRSKGFFRTAPLIPGSIEGLKYLNEKYNVLIVSSATEFPQSLNEKEEWLSEHFPFITWEQMIFCGRKDSIRGNIMIDDFERGVIRCCVWYRAFAGRFDTVCLFRYRMSVDTDGGYGAASSGG